MFKYKTEQNTKKDKRLHELQSRLKQNDGNARKQVDQVKGFTYICMLLSSFDRTSIRNGWLAMEDQHQNKNKIKTRKKKGKKTKRKDFSLLWKVSNSWFDPVIESGWTWPLRITTTIKPKARVKPTTSRKRTNLLLQLNYVRDKASVVIF